MRPEGLEPPTSGFVIRRSLPVELRAQTIRAAARGWRRTQRAPGFHAGALRNGATRPYVLMETSLVQSLVWYAGRGSPARGAKGTARESRSPAGRSRPRRVSTRTASRRFSTRTRVFKQSGPGRRARPVPANEKGALPSRTHRGGQGALHLASRAGSAHGAYTGPPTELPKSSSQPRFHAVVDGDEAPTHTS